ncbi:MAG TPA: hypothetical protein VM617_00535 [Thermoanaerobaculia bacterium]|nr:hypothetical protein [Thermoanaerobaculia bacterium]
MAPIFAWLLPLIALALATPTLWRTSPLAGTAADEAAARRSLAEGNRLVRDGELAAAVESYAAGWNEDAQGDVAGVLAYNLGTTLHRLDRRPEALLWYLRGQPLRPGDRWLNDNLGLVRRELAAPQQAPPGPLVAVAARSDALGLAAVATAWSALALLIVRRREPAAGRRRSAAGGVAFALAVASLLLWLAATTTATLVPRPAVLLAPCGGEEERSDPDTPPRRPGDRERQARRTPPSGGTLPPGTEVWVRPVADGGWVLAGQAPPACPPGAIAVR